MDFFHSYYPYRLPELPYTYQALEPALSAETLRYHHDKHFQTYIDNLNLVLQPYPRLQRMNLEQLLLNPALWPREAYAAIQHNAGGAYNHGFYFSHLAPPTDEGTLPGSVLLTAIARSFGSYSAFQQEFSRQAQALFGSGWTALAADRRGGLRIVSLPNQTTTLAIREQTLLLFDVWEHAYYLQYKNLRADYIKQLWRVVVYAEAGMSR